MINNLDLLKRMAVFVRVVEQGSFTRAADSLELTTSMVSQYVSQLEGELATRLLVRSTRKLSLTDAGRALYRQAAEMVALAEAAQQELQSLTEQPAGTLRLTVPALMQPRMLELISAFGCLHPRVRFELVADDASRDLIAERFDLAVSSRRLQDSRLVAIPIGELQDGVYASPDYLQRYGRPQLPDELTGHDLILHSELALPNQWRFRRGDQLQQPVLRPRYTCNTTSGMLQLAQQGAGICVLPTMLAEQAVAQGTLEQLLVDWQIRQLQIHLVHPYQRQLPLKVRAFIDFIKAEGI